MPRDGTGNYTQPEPVVAPGTTIESAVYNNFTRDVAVDLNTPRPIVAGGTGATNAADARAAMGAETAMQTVTNYDSHIWQNGSFWAGNGATAAPAAGTYSGIVYIANNDPNYITVEARETTTGKLWVRQKAVTWGAWVANDGMIPLAGGVPITGPMTITNTTPSTSPDTGALTVDGGVGINGSINVGGAGYFTGDVFVGYGTAQGVIRFNNNPNNYLYWNGTGYVLNGGPLTINGGLSFTGAMTATGGSFSSNVTIGGTLGVSGYTTLNGLTAGGTTVSTLTVNSALYANAITSSSGSAGDLNNGAGSAALEIRGAGGGAHSYLSFHRPGAYAVNFGLADDGNLWVGGWSKGAGNRSRLWTTADFNYTPQPAGSYQANLGFTPVRQGGGAYQGNNTVYIGWDGGGLRAQVDGSDQGKFLFESAMGPALSNGRTAYAGDSGVPGGGADGSFHEIANAILSGHQYTAGVAWTTGFRHRAVQGYWSGAWRTFNHA